MSRGDKSLLWGRVSMGASVLHPLLWQIRFLFFFSFCPLSTFLLTSPCPEWCCKRTGTVCQGLAACRMNPLWVCELLTPTGLKGRESQPRGSGFEASERWRGRKGALQRLHFHLLVWSSLGILALVLLLEHAFAFSLSIGFLSSRAVGKAANLSGSSCCKFWEMLKKLSLLQKDTWAAAEVTEPPAKGCYSLLYWENSFEGRREQETKGFLSACSLCSFSMLCEASVTLVWLW